MARPDQLSLITVVYALGVLVARARGGAPDNVIPGLLALLSVGIVLHYANEYVDYETDASTTRTRYSGGSGALHAVGLGPRFARRGTAAAGLLAVTSLPVAALVGIPALAISLLALMLALGLAYSLPPRLAWRGLGELTNATLGGLVLPLYGMTTIGYVPDLVDVLTFLPFTAVVFVNLLATQWPDRQADRTVGKRTLAVRLSISTLRRLYVAVTAVSLLALVSLATAGIVPLALLGLSVPTYGMLAVGARRYGTVESPALTVHAMVAFAVAHVVAAGCLWP